MKLRRLQKVVNSDIAAAVVIGNALSLRLGHLAGSIIIEQAVYRRPIG